MTMRVRMSIKMDNTSLPEMPSPPMLMTMSIDVESVSKDGDATYAFRLLSVEALPSADVSQQTREGMETEIKKFVGVHGRATVTAQGLTKDASYEFPPGLTDKSSDLIDNLKQQLEQMASPFPAEPVGVGATWDLSAPQKTSALTIQQSARYTLKKLSADGCELEVKLAQSALPQPFGSNKFPPGVSATLDSFTGAGTGTVAVGFESFTPMVQLKTENSTSTTVEAKGEKHLMRMHTALDLDIHEGAPIQHDSSGSAGDTAQPARPTSDSEGDTQEQLKTLRDRKKEVFEAISEALLLGDLPLAEKRLLDGFPEETRTPLEQLLIGETLFPVDEERAGPFLEKAAHELQNPAAYLELAIAQQRRGECKAALLSWDHFFSGIDSPTYKALVAECRLKLGDAKGALAAWKESNQPSRHSSIETAIADIHGERSPVRRRCDLWLRIRGGDNAAAAELLALDAHFDIDWWNAEFNAESFDSDLRQLRTRLSKSPALLADLETFAKRIRTPKDELPAALRSAKWILGPSARLPASPFALRLIARLALSKDGLADTLLDAHEAELRRRVKAGDKIALDLLAALLSSSGRFGDLSMVDKEGWDRFKDPEYAVSYIFHLKPTSPDDPTLQKAIRQFPLNSPLRTLCFSAGVKPETVALPALLPIVIAEFSNPSGLMSPHDSYRLKAYFGLIEAALAKTEQQETEKH